MDSDSGIQPYSYGDQTAGRRKSRSRTGILIMAIGLVLSAIPTVGDYLGILVLIGLIITVAGASEISRMHRRMSIVSLVIFIVAFGVELVGVLRYSTLISIILSGTSLSYSPIVKYTDTFLFLMSLAYVMINASLILAVYSVFARRKRIILWAFYVIAFLVFTLGIYSSMNTLNGLYYQTVTLSNIGVLSSVANDLEGFGALFFILWAIAYFLAFFDLRKTPALHAPGPGPVTAGQGFPDLRNVQRDFRQPQPPPGQETGNGFSKQTEQSGPWPPPPVPPASNLSGGSEMILFIHPGAALATIDRKRVSIPPFSGSVAITDRRFIFLSKGKGATLATGLLGGTLTYGVISRATTSVDVSEINEALGNTGSLSVDLRSIRKINASPSTVLHPGRIEVEVADEVRPNGTDVSGNHILFAFMARGSPRGTILKEEEAQYLNNKISEIIGNTRYQG